MTFPCAPTHDRKASRMMRTAILQQLHCPPSDPWPPSDRDEPVVDKLQQVARGLVAQAAQGGDQGSPRPRRRQNAAERPPKPMIVAPR